MSWDSIYKLSLILSVVDNMTSPMNKMTSNAKGNIGVMESLSGTFDSAVKSGMLMTGAGVEIAQGIMKPVEATFDTKRAISELSSLGVEKLEMMENAAKSFSNTWSGTTKSDFITAAYDIKSGIASLSDEGVASYTEMAGITAIATKSTVETMTSLFATGYGIYKDFYSDLSDEQFATLFSAGISTSVKAFKTNGDEMSAAIESLGASATNAKVPLEEQLSVLGMLQATMAGSEAGTKYNAFLRSAVKGGKSLGLSFVDANNQMLSMPEILDKLHGKFGDTIDAAEKLQLQEAFGDEEAVKLIDLLYNKTGDLQNNILSVYESMGMGASATLKMADAINSSDPAAFDKLSQKAHNVAETIGNIVSPKIVEYGNKISGMLDKVDAWAMKNPELVNTIFMVLLALGAFLITGGMLITTVGMVGRSIISMVTMTKQAHDAFKLLSGGAKILLPHIKSLGTGILSFGKTAVTAATSALTPLIASVWSFTAALLANPVTWIVIGIVALITGLVILYNKCEGFRNIVNSIAGVIQEKLSKAFEIAKKVFSGIAQIASVGLNAARTTVQEKLNNIKNAYVENGGGIRGIAAATVEAYKSYYTAGFTFLDKLTGGSLSKIRDKFSEKLEPIRNIFSNVMSAAGATVQEKLNNIRNAYVENGGGIRGIAAATMEAYKSYYTAGFTFVDNLTGGRLTKIINTFRDKINGIKNVVSNSIQWFKNSGRKIMTTFTEGIRSAINHPVETVRTGLQKIRNMLPFSDAKTGPLSKLTLSGTKVMSTLSSGIKKGENLPAIAVNDSFEKIDLSLKKKEGKVKTEDLSQKAGESKEEKGTSVKSTVIEKLILNVDLKTLKDLKQLLKLLEEVEEYTGSNGDEAEVQPV